MNEILTSEPVAARDGLALSAEFHAPVGDLQERICAAFAEALSVTPVGMDDDFFDLGGDSMNAEVLAMLLGEVLSQPFPMSGLLECATPRLIEQAFGPTERPKPSTRDVPIFLVHGKIGYSMLRPTFQSGLREGRRVVIFEFPGLRDNQPTPHRIEGVAAHYVAQLVEQYPVGPIHLGAFCTGGLIAIEMAHQLKARGRPVAHLALIDPGMPTELRLRHQGKSDHLLRRLALAPFTGRFSGRVAPADFADDRLLAIRVGAATRRRKLRLALHRLRGTIGRGARLHGFNVAAKEYLTTSYRHYWPKPVEHHVDLICAPDNTADMARADGIWAHILPNRRVHAVLEEHSDVGSRIAAETLEMIIADDGQEMRESLANTA